MSGSPDRVVMSRGLALLFGAGATFVVLTLLLPHGSNEAHAALLIPAGLAYVVVTLLLAAPTRWPVRALQVVLAVGTVLVGICVLSSGRAGGAYAFMYVWVALYASAFFSIRATIAHAAWVGVSYAVVLGVSGDVHPPPAHWLLAVGTSSVAAALILVLSRELRGRAEDLATITELANELGGASEVTGTTVASAVCAGVGNSAGAAAVVLFEEDPNSAGLRLLGRWGTEVDAAVFQTGDGIGAVDSAFRNGHPARMHDAGGGVRAIIQPVLRDGRVAGLLAVAWERPRRRLTTRLEDTMTLFAAEAGIALERMARQEQDRERRALELNDGIVQGLVVATYALRNGHVDMGERAVAETLERARALVEGQLEELHGSAAPEPGTLRREGRGIG